MRLVVAAAVSALVIGLGAGAMAGFDVEASRPARVIVAPTDVDVTEPSEPSDTTGPVDTANPTTPDDSTAPATIGSSVAGVIDDDSSSVTTLGIVIGVIGIVALVGLAAWWMVRRDDIDDAPHPPEPGSMSDLI